MNDLPTPPENTLSEEQKKIFKNLGHQIEPWKKFLTDLGYKVLNLGTDTYENEAGEGFFYPCRENIVIYGHFTPSEAMEQNTLFCGAGYVTAAQFLEDRYWPDSFNDTPRYVEFAFNAKNEAFVRIDGNEGDILFEEENHFKDEEGVTGTWDEVAKILMSISKEMAESLKIQNPPTV